MIPFIVTPAPDAIEAVAALVAVIAALYGLWRWLRPKIQRAWGTLVAALDSIVGRDEVRDSITGKVLAPELPGIGKRMAHQEQQMELLTVTVTKLVDQQVHQQKLEQRVSDVEDRVTKLENSTIERIASRAESAAAYRAIETAIKATPDVEGDTAEDA